MKTKTLVDAILKSGIKIHLKDNNQLKAILPPDFDDDILLQNIKDHKQEVIDYLQVKTSTISPMVMPTEEQEYYGLSNGQQRLWLVNKFLNGQHSLHNNVTKYHINKLDADCLEKAFNILIQRHEILRTNFFTIGGEPKQKIRDIAIGEFKFDFSDFTDMKGQKLNNKIDEHVKEEVLHPFDLQKDLPIRVKLLEIEKSNYVLLITIHHIANDGWSYNIMVSELLQIYSDLLSKTSPNLPPNTIHYRDYVKWQSNAINSEDEKYWLDTLSKDCESVHFHKDFISNQNNSFNGAYSRLSIASEQLEILKRYAVNHKTSLSNLVYSVFVLLLHKLTGQQEFVIGLTNANRNNLDLEKVVGFFINTLVINNQIQPDQSFDELLEHLSNTLFLAQKHQNYPYDKLIEKINPDRTVGSQSLYNVAYSYQNFADIATYDNLVAHEGTDNLHGLSIESQKVDFPLAEFDLNLVVVESDKGLQLTFRYNTDLFLEATVNKWLTHFELLVGQIIKGIESEKHLPIRQLHILDPSSVEYDQIVNTFNNTDSPLPIAKSIPLLFQEHVNLQGNKEAINFNGESISYQELDEFSNRIANFLLSQQTEIEDRVVIILDNSIELVASILGVLKAGGCYVCVDPKFPQKRIEFIINDTAPKTVISTSDTFEKLSLNKCESVKTGLVFDQQVDNDSARATHENRSVVIQIFDNESVNNCGNHHPEIAVEPSNLAYITYTSGSTGNPKGVLVEQKSVVRLVRNTNYFEIDNKDRLLQTATSSFDASTFEIWAPLLNGASLYITDQQTLLNAGRVGKYLKENAISVCWFTSSYFNRLVDIDPHIFDYLNTILVGGEALSVKHVNKVREVNNNLKIVNGYGPTENTTFSSCHLIEEEYSAEIPIGKPISNSKCYVLDSDMNVQPIGTPGYLFVGGTGLSRGYLNNPELTHQKFVDSPFTLGEKLYSTGDLAWWSDEGLLHYKGRLDHQVKIRGFRIEVDEVEHHLNSIKGIDKAVVIVEDDSSQEKYLSAYFTSKEDLKIEDIKVALSEVLPEYMIPSNLFHVDSFPLTINGK
ncbi:MAG: amino acid adenylation domain-containing protein, partial [Bacteroidota bacterium]